MSNSQTKYDVVVLGSGVIGLTVAKELVGKGLKVAVVARDLAEDVHSAGFASPWAGANWSSSAERDNEREKKWDTATFQLYETMSKEHSELVERTPLVRVFNDKEAHEEPWFRDLVFGYRYLEPNELPPGGWKNADTFESYTMNPPAYIGHLTADLKSKGCTFIRKRVSALDEAYSFPSIGPVDLVVNATGLGSRTLLGVQDELCYPIKGQTVLVRAPGMKTIYKKLDKRTEEEQKAGKRFYIIPRPGGDEVVLGGTEMDDNYDIQPDPAIGQRIMKEAYEICPALSGGKGWEEIDVVSHNVGLRPARRGGARLEVEHRVIGQGVGSELLPKAARAREGEKVTVVHAYGIGSAGYQASVGIGIDVRDMVMAELQKQRESTTAQAGPTTVPAAASGPTRSSTNEGGKEEDKISLTTKLLNKVGIKNQ